MLYIHKMSCISPQHTFSALNLNDLLPSEDNKLLAIEPSYEGIPPGQLRRMGKASRLGVGAAMPLLKNSSDLDGIIIGTANGGMEDCIKFLNQIIEYEEGVLTPTNFVQSTTNAIASQIAFMSKNKGYNITHVHRGLSFENALQDAMMHALESPSKTFLLGGVDEISDYNFNIDFLQGCFKEELTPNNELYKHSSDGTIAGEGAAMFVVNGLKEYSLVAINDMKSFQSRNEMDIEPALNDFLEKNKIAIDEIDLYVSGENGDQRISKFYGKIENLLPEITPVLRYKHLTGEHPSASALGLWFSCQFLNEAEIPDHMMKKGVLKRKANKILLYNCYQGLQHSFILLST